MTFVIFSSWAPVKVASHYLKKKKKRTSLSTKINTNITNTNIISKAFESFSLDLHHLTHLFLMHSLPPENIGKA